MSSLCVAGDGSLAVAVANGDIKEVAALLEGGVDPDQRSSDGFAPLCIAAFWGYADMVKLLLNKGANINVSNSGTGWTPCHCAAFQGHGKVMLHLSQAKPDLSIQDTAGRTASDFGSALESVWPFFVAMGCSRTSKAELVRLDIIKKSEPRVEKGATNSGSDGQVMSRVSHLSRPGSSYVLNTRLLQPSRSTQMSAALAFGDVLQEEPFQHSAGGDKSGMNLWQT
ncbi:ankyrin repeat and SOCS box protein 3-like [Halichondria panicea]|uniref:ankyrin repeat and SOCS box protein 3-like n=1 Tax=Halichondria panicea TaxID=6063 RepID=UPI00312B3CC3